MLETYFARPQTVDRVRALWIGPEIERYVDWLGRGTARGACCGVSRCWLLSGSSPGCGAPGRWRTCRVMSMRS